MKKVLVVAGFQLAFIILQATGIVNLTWWQLLLPVLIPVAWQMLLSWAFGFYLKLKITVACKITGIDLKLLTKSSKTKIDLVVKRDDFELVIPNNTRESKVTYVNDEIVL